MLPDFADAGNHRILETGRLLILLELGGIRSGASEAQHVNTDHVSIHFFKGAGFDQGMNSLARADWEMMLAMGADLEVFVQFLVENHGAALGTFGP